MKKVFVVSNTHWDREWRYTNWELRFQLVDMMDGLLELLRKNPKYKCYHLDSQTSALEDYLEIRPEKKKEIERFVKSGRLLIGPWYTLPDEFLVDGESLIRNLLMGHRIASSFGRVFKVGYSPFSWGHVSQLPQIYKGFGIDTAIFYRGINDQVAPVAEFWWEGADGTRVLASRLSTWPRYNFWYYIYRPYAFGRSIPDRRYFWQEGSLPFKLIDPQNFLSDYFLIMPIFQHNKKILPEALKNIIEEQYDFSTENLLWMQGHDSSFPYPELPRLLREVEKVLKKLIPEAWISHASLEEYVESLKKSLQGKDLKVLKGEMRYVNESGRTAPLFGYVTSARMYLKQLNHSIEKLLIYYAEPVSSIMWLFGEEYPRAFLDIAWRYVLQNHAHDSIGGCSIDRVHEDMVARFNAAGDIAGTVFKRGLSNIAKRLDTSEDNIYLMVYNPLPVKRNEIVEAFVEIPYEVSQQWSSLTLVAPDGEKIEPVICEVYDNQTPIVQHSNDSPLYILCRRAKILFEAQGLPPMGYRVYRVVPKKKPKRFGKGLATGPNSMENEYLRVEINPDGTLNVLHKETGRIYKGLHYFEDSGEAGNPWERIPPEKDEIIFSKGCSASISLVENTPVRATFLVRYELLLPVGLSADGKSRSRERKILPIETRVTLEKGSRVLKFSTVLDNTVEDHRLRVVFPTGIDVNKNFADSAFDVVERSNIYPDDSSWVEPYMREKPLNRFVDVSDENGGVSVFVDGLKEYEHLEDGSIAITLLRAFKLKICVITGAMTDYSYQKGSQCLGKQFYRYALFFHAENWENATVPEEALLFDVSIGVAQFGPSKGSSSCALGFEESFIELSGGVILTACKQSESGDKLVLRFFNPYNVEKRVGLRLSKKLLAEKVYLLNLDESIQEELHSRDNVIEFKIKPKKIVTLGFVLKAM